MPIEPIEVLAPSGQVWAMVSDGAGTGERRRNKAAAEA